MNKALSVFTCTYNRRDTISRTYESLCRQSSKDFIWVVVDDGSTDNTKEYIYSLIHHPQTDVDGVTRGQSDFDFPIWYVYKENGGLHTGYNKAIEIMDSELCVCIDSDDWMPDDAVEKIITFWKENNKNNTTIGGIVGLDFNKNNQVIGDFLPNINISHIWDLKFKFHVRGDKKIVLKTKLLKEVAPQPSYAKEKNFNPMYLITKIDYYHYFLLLNQNLCFVEYQNGGMTSNQFKQFNDSPNSFAATRIANIQIPFSPFKFKLKQYIHLGSSVWLSKNYTWLYKAPNKFLSYSLFPLGILLAFYIKYKSK